MACTCTLVYIPSLHINPCLVCLVGNFERDLPTLIFKSCSIVRTVPSCTTRGLSLAHAVPYGFSHWLQELIVLFPDLSSVGHGSTLASAPLLRALRNSLESSTHTSTGSSCTTCLHKSRRRSSALLLAFRTNELQNRRIGIAIVIHAAHGVSVAYDRWQMRLSQSEFSVTARCKNGQLCNLPHICVVRA